MILRMAEITLIEAIASIQVVTEAQRNLLEKIPTALPAFQLIVKRCIRTCEDPTVDELSGLSGMADPKDLPILAAALQEGCSYLATFNVRHFHSGAPGIKVLKPGDLVLQVRYLLSRLS